MSDIRMWSHYASGHTGCAIEIELEHESPVFEVTYSDGIKHFASTVSDATSASEILSFKTSHWAYEREFRVISGEEFFPILNRITGVYLGIRIAPEHKELILQNVPSGVPVFECKMDQKLVEIRSSRRLESVAP